MSRIKIPEPEHIHFETKIQLRIEDMNYGNHLANEKVLAMAHEARLRFFNSMGANEFDFFGVGLIQADAGITYKSEGFYGDTILIQIGIQNLSRMGFDVNYRMYNESTQRELATLKTGVVCFDYTAKKPLSLPQEFIDALEKLA